MSESYDAIYAAVRSKISGGNVGEAIENAIRNADIGHFVMMAAENARAVFAQYERPSVLYRPTIAIDGNKWCALYGEDLMNGVCGFGDTPALAMEDFDNNWRNARAPARSVDTPEARALRAALTDTHPDRAADERREEN